MRPYDASWSFERAFGWDAWGGCMSHSLQEDYDRMSTSLARKELKKAIRKWAEYIDVNRLENILIEEVQSLKNLILELKESQSRSI